MYYSPTDITILTKRPKNLKSLDYFDTCFYIVSNDFEPNFKFDFGAASKIFHYSTNNSNYIFSHNLADLIINHLKFLNYNISQHEKQQ